MSSHYDLLCTRELYDNNQSFQPSVLSVQKRCFYEEKSEWSRIAVLHFMVLVSFVYFSGKTWFRYAKRIDRFGTTKFILSIPQIYLYIMDDSSLKTIKWTFLLMLWKYLPIMHVPFFIIVAMTNKTVWIPRGKCCSLVINESWTTKPRFTACVRTWNFFTTILLLSFF